MRSSRTRWALAGALVLILPFVAGCKIEMALDTSIDAGGSGTIGVRLAADKEIQDLIASQGGAQGDLFGEFEGSVPEGWASDSGTDADGTSWVTASRAFSDPSEITAFLEEGQDGPAASIGAQAFSLTQDKGLLSVRTVFSGTWDMQSALAATGDQVPEGMDPSALSSIFEVQNRLTLPGSIKENNADEIDGNTLIWRPSVSGVTEMSAVSVAYRWPVVGGIAGVVVLLAATIAAAAFFGRRGKGGPVSTLVAPAAEAASATAPSEADDVPPLAEAAGEPDESWPAPPPS